MLTDLPNVLTLSRIAAIPLMVILVAIKNSRRGYCSLYGL